VTLPAFAAEGRAAAPLLQKRRAAIDHYFLPAGSPGANPLPLLSIDGTDRRTLDRFIDPALHTMQAAS